MFRIRSHTTVLAVTAAAAALALSACGDDSPESSAGPTKLTVGVSPGAATSAPMYMAVKKGVFSRLGLDVKLTVLKNGTIAIPQVMNGQTQFSMASFAPVAQAVGKGLPVRLIGAANVVPTDPKTKYHAFIVRSGISSIDQVKTLAAPSTEVDPVQAYAVDELGGDYMSMKRLQLSLPAIGEALKRGDADGAVLQEPFLSKALEGGGVEILSYLGPDLTIEGAPGAAFIGSEKYMKENPEIAAGFVKGIQEAYSYGQQHLDEVAAFVPETGLSDEVPPVVALGQYQEGPVDPATVGRMLDVFVRYGVLEGGTTAADMMYEPEGAEAPAAREGS